MTGNEPPTVSRRYCDPYRWCDVTADVFDVFDDAHADHHPDKHHQLYVVVDDA